MAVVLSVKRCPKWPTATPTIRLPVVVDLGWASRDVKQFQSVHTLCAVRGFPVVASYVAWRIVIYSDNVGSYIHVHVFVQDHTLGGEPRAKGYGIPFVRI